MKLTFLFFESKRTVKKYQDLITQLLSLGAPSELTSESVLPFRIKKWLNNSLGTVSSKSYGHELITS